VVAISLREDDVLWEYDQSKIRVSRSPLKPNWPGILLEVRPPAHTDKGLNETVVVVRHHDMREAVHVRYFAE
jgi:hypothetical protein